MNRKNGLASRFGSPWLSSRVTWCSDTVPDRWSMDPGRTIERVRGTQDQVCSVATEGARG